MFDNKAGTVSFTSSSIIHKTQSMSLPEVQLTVDCVTLFFLFLSSSEAPTRAPRVEVSTESLPNFKLVVTYSSEKQMHIHYVKHCTSLNLFVLI